MDITEKDRILHLPFLVLISLNCVEIELDIQKIHSRFFIASSIWEFSKLSR